MKSADTPSFRSLALGLLALAASAIILLGAFVFHSLSQLSAGSDRGQSRLISGVAMESGMGSAKFDANGLQITALQNTNNQGDAVVSWQGRFQANDYLLLTYRLQKKDAHLKVEFFWRTLQDSQNFSFMPMHPNKGKPSTLALGLDPNWQGTVIQIGIHVASPYVTGELDQPVEIRDLALRPYSWQGSLAATWSQFTATWSQWTEFRGWSQRSINHLQRTSPSATVAMAAWGGLASVLLLGAGLVTRTTEITRYAVAMLIPWITLDLVWQGELSDQLQQSKGQFAEKSVHEKHLASMDRHLYAHAKRLKDHILPTTPARIFILHHATGHNYERLKAQYYLLPHNIFNYGNTPPIGGVKPGDYILSLRDSADMTFSPDEGVLLWGENLRLGAEEIDKDPMGTLYRVPPYSRPNPSAQQND